MRIFSYRSVTPILLNREAVSSYQGTKWVFTINNPREKNLGQDTEDRDWGVRFFKHIDVPIKYLVYCLETGEENGTLHYQGYVVLTKKKKNQAMQNKFRGWGYVRTQQQHT